MKIILLIVSVAISLVSVSQKLTAKEIIEKSDQILKGVSTTKAEMVITTVRPKWSKTMKVKTWSKDRNKSLIFIEAPAKDKGITFLMKEEEVWNWIPSIERTIKMPPSMMMQNWMGTDFSFGRTFGNPFFRQLFCKCRNRPFFGRKGDELFWNGIYAVSDN